MKKCEHPKCDNVFEGNKRFCSKFCARSFSTFLKREEINEKVSKKLKNTHLSSSTKKRISEGLKNVGKERGEKISEKLKEYFKDKNNRLKVSIYTKGKKISESTKKKISEKAKIRVNLGLHKGWKKRFKYESSYAEKFFENVLNNNNLIFEKEYKINRFFADFAFIDNKVVLEIDGKQHQYRKDKDKIKDEFLEKEGWRVFRIDWRNPKNIENSKYIKNKINEFLKFYYRDVG